MLKIVFFITLWALFSDSLIAMDLLTVKQNSAGFDELFFRNTQELLLSLNEKPKKNDKDLENFVVIDEKPLQNSSNPLKPKTRKKIDALYCPNDSAYVLVLCAKISSSAERKDLMSQAHYGFYVINYLTKINTFYQFDKNFSKELDIDISCITQGKDSSDPITCAALANNNEHAAFANKKGIYLFTLDKKTTWEKLFSTTGVMKKNLEQAHPIESLNFNNENTKLTALFHPNINDPSLEKYEDQPYKTFSLPTNKSSKILKIGGFEITLIHDYQPNLKITDEKALPKMK